jgi:two-component system, chemotaxis family, protein-glutamate methylesterase/glutaminase
MILTGFLKDGTAGLKTVHDAGGLTIVQDPTEAEYADMPTNAMQDLPVTFCLKLAEIGPLLMCWHVGERNWKPGWLSQCAH